MGNCCESSLPKKKNILTHKKLISGKVKLDNSLEISNDEFPDMPLWNNGKKVGFGIKEMPAYKCDLKINQLEKKRDKFWKSHKTNIQQWNIIHQAIVYPHIKSEEYLASHGFKTLDGCINMCVDPQGNVFRVPNYCINDPYFELALLPKTGGNNSNMLNVILMDATRTKNMNLNISENTTGKELINLYANKNNINQNLYMIRLLFGGGIIRNDETLYQHKVKNGQIIQVSVFKNN